MAPDTDFPGVTQFDGDGWRGCQVCGPYSCNWQQTVYTMHEAKKVFFSKDQQRHAFDQPIEKLEEIGVTHACYKCGHWFFGLSDEGIIRVAAKAVAADFTQAAEWPMIYGTRQTELSEFVSEATDASDERDHTEAEQADESLVV